MSHQIVIRESSESHQIVIIIDAFQCAQSYLCRFRILKDFFCNNSLSNFRSDVGESTSLNVGVDAQKFPEGDPRGSNEIKEDETKRLVICNFCHR